MKLKKILALVLCVAMVLSTMSFTAFAEAAVYEVTNDTELAEALKNAVDGDTIKLAAGEYKGGISVGKDIILEGSVDEDGNPATVFNGGGTAIYISKGTVKNIKIENASKGFYGEPCGNVVFDNVHMINLLYGFHLVAYSSDVTWTIKNCYTDVTWANSFGKHNCDGATIILKNNEFVSTNPYYGEDYGANLVNTFCPNTTIEDNIFGKNANILIREDAKDGAEIGPNYYEDGYENAISEDCADGVNIKTYYVDESMTETAYAPYAEFEYCQVNAQDQNGSFITVGMNELYAENSIKLEIYDGNDKLLAVTEATDKVFDELTFPIPSISAAVSITYSDEYWTTTWEKGMPKADCIPEKAVLTIDGMKIGTTDVKMVEAWTNKAINWADVPGVFAMTTFEAENNMTEDDLSSQSLLITFKDVPYIENNMTVKLYHDDELLSTTDATAKRLGQAYDSLTTNVVYYGDAAISGSWTTELNSGWSLNKAPNKVVVDIDGTESSFEISEIVAYSKFEKFNFPSITPGYVTSAQSAVSTKVWGEAKGAPSESWVVELYAGEEKIAQAELQNIDNIIDGTFKNLTWNMPYDGGNDSYWKVTWYNGNPVNDVAPTKVVFVVDGIAVAENVVKMSGPDDVNKTEWDNIEAIRGRVKLESVSLFGRKDRPYLYSETVSKGSYCDFDFENNKYTFKYYSADKTLLAETTISKDTITEDYNPGAYGNIAIYLVGEDENTDTTWYVAPNAQQVPAYAELYINDIYESTCDNVTYWDEFGGRDMLALTDKVWAETNNVVKFNEEPTVFEKTEKGTRNNIGLQLGNLYAESEIKVEYYAGEDKIATTTWQKAFPVESDDLSVNTVISGEPSGSWNTVWHIGPSVNYVPTSAKVYIDGKPALVADTIGFQNADYGRTKPITQEQWASIEGVAGNVASAVNVILEPTDNKNVYNIKLQSADEYDIYEFVAAEFTFKNESTTVGGAEMKYEISGYTENDVVKTVVEQAAGEGRDAQYIIRIPDGAEANRLSGHEFIIGQVKFIGQATTQFQGNIKFSVIEGEVDTTKEGTHLGKYYTVNDENAKLNLGADAAIDSTVSEIKRNVAVNVAFKHNIDGNYWNDNQIKATIKNNFGYEEEQTIEISAIDAGATTFVDVPLGQITVTLTAPGFRTYTYKTVVEETADNGVLVLNFWNDVKRYVDEAIETGKGFMSNNFLVGDIVMDYTVDKYDLAAVTSYYGTYEIDKAEAEKYIKYDLNRDGDIDIRDVQYVLHTMGN